MQSVCYVYYIEIVHKTLCTPCTQAVQKQVCYMLCLTADQVSALSIYVRQPDSPSSVSHCSCSNRSMQAALPWSQVGLGVWVLAAYGLFIVLHKQRECVWGSYVVEVDENG